jgi:hypothetical protein
MRTGATMSKRDLLVGLACITFLLLNLAMIGSRGRRRAKEAVCLSNLRQWGVIAYNHTQENDGQFWDTAPGTPGYWWIKYLEDDYKDWKRNKIWFCPEAKVPIVDELGHTRSSINIFYAWGIYKGSGLGENGISGSYGLSGYVLLPTGSSTYDNGVPVEYGWHTPDVAGADTIPIFLDALRFDLWPKENQPPATNEFSAWSGNYMARCCINRHNGAVGSLFMDFSARKVGLKELWKLKWHRQFNTDGPFTLAGGVQPTDWPQWIREFKDY